MRRSRFAPGVRAPLPVPGEAALGIAAALSAMHPAFWVLAPLLSDG